MKNKDQSRDRAAKILRQAGHTDVKQDEQLITKAIHEHEDADHGGKHTALKFKHGGKVDGREARAHGGRLSRAKGGRAKGTTVNILVAGKHPADGASGMGETPAAAATAPNAMPHPPMPAPSPVMGGAPAGAPPMGAPAGIPNQPMRALGGRLHQATATRGYGSGKSDYPVTDGSGGGKGRLEKQMKEKARGRGL